MKKNICLVLLIIITQYIFSQTYYINKDTKNYNPRGFQDDVELPAGSLIYLDNESKVSSYRPDEDTHVIKISGLYQDKKLTFYSTDLNILNNDTFDTELLEKKWISSYYFTILKSNQIQQSLLEYESFWKKWVAIDSWETDWVESFNLTNIILSNTNLFVPMIGHLESSFVIFSTLKRTDSGYIAEIKSVDPYTNHPVFVPLLKANEKSFLSFTIDGDYMTMNLDDKEIIKLCACDEYMFSYIKNCIKNNKCDLSKVTWPRHADGSSDYDDEIKPPLVQHSDDSSLASDIDDETFDYDKESDLDDDELFENDEEITEDDQLMQEPVAVVERTSNMLMIIILASAGVLVLLVVVLVIVLARKKHRKQGDNAKVLT